MISDWDLFAEEVADFDVRHVRAGGRFVFSFVEGPLVKALRKGDWSVCSPPSIAPVPRLTLCYFSSY
jgi:midasin